MCAVAFSAAEQRQQVAWGVSPRKSVGKDASREAATAMEQALLLSPLCSHSCSLPGAHAPGYLLPLLRS